MPIYEYLCADCGTRKEHLQKLADAPIAACPACGSAQYAKQLTAAGFQLKGSGWYASDFKGGPKEACPMADPAAPPPPCAGSCACH